MSGFDEEAFRKFQLSGKILRETREEMKSFVREGTSVIDICEKAEQMIKKKGGEPAFPCNVSINEVAAHYTSPPKDRMKIPKNSIVKVDMGVHVDGYVTDTAVTLYFHPKYRPLINAVRRALKVALDEIHPGISTSRVGSIIEKAIKSRGFQPISNLTGHQIGRYQVHTGTSVPNVSRISFSKLKLGRVYALEPFVTFPEAAGRVENGKEVTIFRYHKRKSLDNPYAKQLLEYIKDEFRTLPFAERWIQNVIPADHYQSAFHELLTSKSLVGYPVFIEASRKPVAQAEHTVFMVEDGCIVLT
ncbi:MAG: type II methionyl aminopeptidase [Thermoproteota archaeon]